MPLTNVDLPKQPAELSTASVDPQLLPVGTTNHLAYIDGLRGVAVLGVLIFHSTIWAGVAEHSFLQRLLSPGRAGVDLFLALSGFCLFLPLLKKGVGGLPKMNLWQYAKRRALRICPPFYAALTLMIVASWLCYSFGQGGSWWNQPFQNVFPWHGMDSVKDIVYHLTFTHGLSNVHAHTIDGAYWSLSLEVQFYVLLPVLVWIGRRTSISTAILIPVCVSILYRLVLHRFAPLFLTSYVGEENSFGRWIEFGLGMWAAWQFQKASGAIPRYALPLLLGMALFIEVVRPGMFLLPVVWGLTCAVLISYAGQSTGQLKKFLEQRWLVQVGVFSYSLYLTHAIVFMLMTIPFTRHLLPDHLRTIAYCLFGPVLAIAAAYGFFLMFERPFLSRRSPANT